MSEIKTYDDSFSNLLVEIQGMLGINSRRDASEHHGTLDLVKRLFGKLLISCMKITIGWALMLSGSLN